MSRKQEKTTKPPRSHHGEEAGAIAGELVGAVVGSAAGPVGTVAGMVVGAMVGALTGHVLEDEDRKNQARDHELDEEIGVTSDNLGAAGKVARPAPSSGAQKEAAPDQGPPDEPSRDADDDT